MTIGRRIKGLITGLLAGVVGTLVMALLMVAGRNWLGISPPPEAIPDRFAPTLDIPTFFSLFDRFGGYNQLKQFGIRSGLVGLLTVGSLVGIAYAAVAESGRARRAGLWRLGLSRSGLLFLAITIIVLWVALVIVLWPVLSANYRGLPPSTARPLTAVWLLVTFAAYGLTLILTYRFITRQKVVVVSAGEAADSRSTLVGDPVDRRAMLAGLAGTLLILPTYNLMQRLYDRATFFYDGRPYSGPGIQPVTPNEQFYSVTKNVVDPNVRRSIWRLEVGGLVEAPRTYSFDDLAALPSVDQETTLMCISNRIGSGLFSNAFWRGVSLHDLLDASGVREGAVEVILHGADAYTDTIPFEKAMDPATLVVYEMNGEPLPERNGYPVRVIVPGLYGEKSVKWVTRIEVLDHEAKGFYEQQGWGPDFEIPTRSDLFSPLWRRQGGRDFFVEPMPLGRPVELRGRAFAGVRGISQIEVSVDDGETWREARIDYQTSPLVWVFWSHVWLPADPGEHIITSRATDGNGDPQPTERVGIIPQGARGYHRVAAQVDG